MLGIFCKFYGSLVEMNKILFGDDLRQSSNDEIEFILSSMVVWSNRAKEKKHSDWTSFNMKMDLVDDVFDIVAL